MLDLYFGLLLEGLRFNKGLGLYGSWFLRLILGNSCFRFCLWPLVRVGSFFTEFCWIHGHKSLKPPNPSEDSEDSRVPPGATWRSYEDTMESVNGLGLGDVEPKPYTLNLKPYNIKHQT